MKPTESPGTLGGHRIAICGARGALATAFADHARREGARLVLVDLPPRGADPRDSFWVYADVTDIDQLDQAIGTAWERLGGIDTLVNFAGVHHRPYALDSEDPQFLLDDFRRVVDVNLTGAFAATVVAARRMVPARAGHIIHLCSNGSRASLYGSYAYNASKHGVEGVIKTAAAQLAPFGVRVNGLAPGTVVTDLNRSLLYDENGEVRSRARSILSHTPTKRFATPEGVAESLVALCIPQRHLTGNVLFADDGYNIEGHTWPEGNEALYRGTEDLENLLRETRGERPW